MATWLLPLPKPQVRANFHFQGDEDFLNGNIRTKKDLDGLGALGDLGWYTCKLALWAFGFERPESVMAVPGLEANRNPEGVMMRGGGTLLFAGGKSARMSYSFLHPCCQDATIVCQRGNIWLSDFVLPRYSNFVTIAVLDALFSLHPFKEPERMMMAMTRRRKRR